MTYREAINLQPGDLVVCYGTTSEFNKAETLYISYKIPTEKTAYIPKKIYRVQSTSPSLAFKDVFHIYTEPNKEGNYILYSFQCKKIEFTIPKEGSVLLDELDNWKYLEHTLLKTRVLRDVIAPNDKYLVWYNNSSYYNLSNPEPELKYYNIEDLYFHIPICTVNSNEQTKIKKENGKQNNYKGKSYKINPAVSKVTGGSEYRGNSIRGKLSSVKITIGHLSHTAISCSSEAGS